MTRTEARHYQAKLFGTLEALYATLAAIADQGDEEGDMDPEDTYEALCAMYTAQDRAQLLQAVGLTWSRLADFIGALQQASHGDPRPEPL
ncbi:MAG TPA: hypothetical protein VI542_37795 [Candidatus Tectomicrobia bacterium]